MRLKAEESPVRVDGLKSRPGGRATCSYIHAQDAHRPHGALGIVTATPTLGQLCAVHMAASREFMIPERMAFQPTIEARWWRADVQDPRLDWATRRSHVPGVEAPLSPRGPYGEALLLPCRFIR